MEPAATPRFSQPPALDTCAEPRESYSAFGRALLRKGNEMEQLVYVLSKEGAPLMPTHRCGHVRWLLKQKKARAVRMKPFTIQLQYECPDGVQRLHGGTDPGRTNIGNAVLTDKGEAVYADHVETRNREIPKLMEKRAAHRRASRNGERKRRQRRAKANGTVTEPFEKPRILPKCSEPIVNHGIINTESRFANRKRPDGWLTPTARQLVETHLNMVRKICSILPVTDWTIEINRFAFMRMEDGSVRGIDFQNGRMKGYRSVEEYVFAEQDGICPLCGRPIQHYHHIVEKSKGGSDRPDNIVGLCADCHRKVHTDRNVQKQIMKIGEKKRWSALSVLNQALPYIYDSLADMFGEDHVHFCFGWETSAWLELAGLPKEHVMDAVCIAALGTGVLPHTPTIRPFEVKQYRRHDRALINNQRQRTYKIADGKTKGGKTKWKTVAKNRRKGFAQQEPALDDFISSVPECERAKVLSQLRCVPSKRYNNDPKRQLPGAVFWFRGRRHVMSGQHCGGTYLRAEGSGAADFPAAQCTIVPMGGLVYL